uniref:UDP-glucuronosyltransferase n=1 Tax=Neogobius melanostomus TaxID=47308 RepID=A0A8C6SKV7_9GOBI
MSLASSCDGGNILAFPVDGSHWINMKVLLEELHSRGHSLTVIRGSTSCTSQSTPLSTPLSLSPYIHKKHQRFSSDDQPGSWIWCEAVEKILKDKEMVKSLLDAKYDLMLTDPAIAPGVVLAKYLQLPLVLNVRWVTSSDGQFMLAPSPLSYIPVPGSGLTDRMDFFQRVKNILFYGLTLVQQYFLVGPSYDALCEKYIEGGCDIVSLLQDADIWLFRSDFVFDFPRPTMPNVIYMGGFQCKPAQPLPADLEDFVQMADEIASVFAKLPQKVIWRHIGPRPSTLGNNTMIVDWMPQKDLLGHSQTKVFVAHGGTNGVQEAIYHGVPVLGIPLFFDQFDNLLRLQSRGELLHQHDYRDNIQRLSRLHKDQPMSPMDQAVFWVEFVIRHKGAPHLRTQSYKMPWYSYHCVDVLLLLLTAVIGTVLCAVAVFRLLCCRSRTKMKQQ